MNPTTKKALPVAVIAFDSKESDSPSVDLTDEQRTLLAKLASLAEMIEQHRATVSLLERDRLQLQTQLRLNGYRTPMPVAPE